jgi:hypothetical protein
MTLSEFVEQEKHRLDKFKSHWENMRQADPGSYPEEEPPGYWLEQYHYFSDLFMEVDK